MIYRSTSILFLDIDGVLNSMEYRKSDRYHLCADFPSPVESAKLIDPIALTVLEDVLRRTGAKVVLSSAWRSFPGMPARMQQILEARGSKHVTVVDRTPEGADLLGDYVDRRPAIEGHRFTPRGFEICHWLSTHGPVHSYAIVDDDDDMISIHEHRTREFSERFVLTDFEHGLRADEGERLVQILSTPLTVEHPGRDG